MKSKITTIQVGEKTKQKLARLKYSLGYNDYNEVILAILNIATRVKLASNKK